MATISETQTLTFELRVNDQATAGLNAAAAAAKDFAATEAQVIETVERAGPSVNQLIGRLDKQGQASRSLIAETRLLQQAQAALRQDAAQGGARQEELARSVETGTARVAAAQAKLDGFRNAAQNAAGAAAAAQPAMGGLGSATAALGGSAAATASQMRQLAPQLNDLFTTISTGGGVMQALLQQGGQITPIFGGVRGTLAAMAAALGPVGIAAVVVGGAMLAVGVSAESSARRLDTLQQRLRATRDDYSALAAGAEQSARRVAGSSALSLSDARAAGQAIASSGGFSGVSSELEGLVRLSADVARGLGITVADAAGRLAAALDNPRAAARKLADEGFRTMNEGLVRQVELLQLSGQSARAAALVTEAYARGVGGAADGGTALQRALRSLGNAFSEAGTGGKSLADMLGTLVLTPVVAGIETLTGALGKLRGAIDLLKSGNVIEAIRLLDSGTGPIPNGVLPAMPMIIDVPKLLAGLQPGTLLRDPTTLQGPPIRGTSERAQGMFQVLPSTAAEMGYTNLADPAQNILAGLTYINKMIAATGSVEGGLARYGGYGNNVGNASGYIAKVQSADTSRLPADKAAQIEYWGQVLGLPPDRIELGKRMAMVESGGRQAAGTVQYGPPVAAQRNPEDLRGSEGIARTSGNTVAGFGALDHMGPRDAARASGNYALLPQGDRRTIDGALGGAYDTTGATQARLRAEIAGNEAALKLLADAGIRTGSVVEALTEKQGALRGTLANTRTAYGENIHSLDLAAEASTGATGAARTHADALIAAREAAARMGQETLTASQRLEVHAKVQASLNGQFAEGFNAQLRANDQQQRLNDSYAGGARSMIEYQNRIAAETEAVKTAEEGTSEYREQVDALTAARNRGSAIAADRRTLELGIDQKQQLDELKAEASLIGLSADARERELAVIKERARIARDGGDIASAASKASLANVADIAAQASANKQLEASYTDLANVGVNAFSQVGDAIVQAMSQGSMKALDFGSLFRGVIASIVKQLATLAVINPIMNTLFGGSRSTLDSGLAVLLGAGGAGALAVSGQATTSASVLGPGASGAAGAGVGAVSAAGGGAAAGAGGLGAVSGAKVAYDLGKLVLGSGGGQAIGTAIAGALGQGTAELSSTLTTLAVANAGTAEITTASLAAVSNTQIAISSVAQAAGVSAQSAATAAVQISQALPYIGVAVGVVSQLIQGNFRGAALVATGAALGAAIGSVVPVLGTAAGAAVGAVVGGAVDLLFPQHKKNAFEAIDVNVQDGQLARGKVVSQLVDPAKDTATVDAFAAGINTYMERVGLKLANAPGRIGIVGTGADPKFNNYTANPLDLIKALRFTAAQDDGSNFSIIKKGALPGQQFDTLDALGAALAKLASFSDGVDALGIQLKSVGNDLANIEVSGLKADRLAAAQSGAAPLSNLETAFQNALPRASFANLEAFQAKVTEINNFVNGTYPSLLSPVIETTTSLQKSISDLIHTYADAIAQAQSYGLATEGLVAAQAKGIQLLQAPAIQALSLGNLQILMRGQTARGEGTQGSQLEAFDIQADQQRTQLADAFKNIWGGLTAPAKEYAAAAKTLDETLAAERVALVKQTNQAILDAEKQAADALVQAARGAQDAGLAVFSQFISIRARQKALSGDERGAETDTFNLRAIDETKGYDRQLADYYGASFRLTTDYHNRMKELETVQAQERLAIAKKYNGQLTQAAAQAYTQARGSVLQAIGGLADYARTLQTGAASPLAPQAQYSLARSQFQAVRGAAAAGDFNSLQKLQGYSDALLTASRAVNGSGTGYAADYKAVLAALQSAATAPVDKLTDSAMKAATEEQTKALSRKFDELRAELVSVRRELQQQVRAPVPVVVRAA